jgi:hypothetical protein
VAESERRSDGPLSFSDIMAQMLEERTQATSRRSATAELERELDTDAKVLSGRPVERRVVAGPEYLLHETEMLRRPVYRTERSDSDDDPPASYFDQPAAHQLPLLTYEYDADTTVISRIGELGTRDMLVMSVLSQAFYANGCPDDNLVRGDEATLGYVARQLGMHPEGATRLIRSSIERLSTARVKIKLSDVNRDVEGGSVSTQGEVTVGFLSNFGWRERKQRGRKINRDNYIQLDQAMADLIRSGRFTFLRADVLRALRRQPLALKLYAWGRTHRPDDRGRIFYSVTKLAQRLGCSDQNSTRRRKKLLDAVEAVCAAAPDEFTGYNVRQGRHDQVVTLTKKLRRPDGLPTAAPS